MKNNVVQMEEVTLEELENSYDYYDVGKVVIQKLSQQYNKAPQEILKQFKDVKEIHIWLP